MKKILFIILLFCTYSANCQNFFWSYNNSSATVPFVITNVVTSISLSSATGGGNVTSSGGNAVSARGVCWNTTLNPTISNSKTTDGSGVGTFTSSLTGLLSNTTYFVRAYATNGIGTGYGENESFVTTGVSNSGYGKLYNYYAVTDSRNIAATGWHVPSRAELDALITATGGKFASGGKLKETGTSHWLTPNTGADNFYSFTAVGAGIRDPSIEGKIQEWCEFWSNQSGIVMLMQYNSSGAQTGINVPIRRGISVRLIKDDSTLASYTGNDGKVYTTVKIGTQVWTMNLRETKYRDGSDIQNVTNYSTWNNLTTGAWCWFNNDSRYE